MKYGAGLTPQQRLARLEQVVIERSIGTQKGDIAAFSAAGVPSVIPAATSDGKRLGSDMSEPSGAAWKDNRLGFLQYAPDPGGQYSTGLIASGVGVQVGLPVSGIPGGIPLIFRAGMNGPAWILGGAVGQWEYELGYGDDFATATWFTTVTLAPFSASNYLLPLGAGELGGQYTLPAGTWNIYARVRNNTGSTSNFAQTIIPRRPVWISVEYP